MDTYRRALEEQAQAAICTCFYYDLCDTLDSLTDDELWCIIDIPNWSHFENRRHNPMSDEEFEQELRECGG